MSPPAQARAPGWTLPASIVLACLADAVASTALALGRADVIGDTHATPDEFAWLDIAYGAAKLMGFALCPWIVGRLPSRVTFVGSVLAIGAACGLAAATAQLGPLVLLRAVQGVAGAIMLVIGQAILFWTYPAQRQPLVQAIFAMGAVVAPATIAPALEGWLLDNRSWAWIFYSALPLSLVAAGLAMFADRVADSPAPGRPPDWLSFLPLVGAMLAATYALTQGNRWDWFESAQMRWWTLGGGACLAAFILRQRAMPLPGPFDVTVLRDPDFAFAIAVSFVAGAVLFGSAYVIPAFAVTVLGFTPTDAGLLLLPSGALFVAALLLAAWLFQARGLPAILTVPFGVLAIMAAMWLLSGSSGESGATAMLPAVLLRGAGLGLLFLSITLIAFDGLDPAKLPSAIAMFNTGRQLGGLIGVAGLQIVIEQQTAADRTVLGAALTHASPVAVERVAALTSLLTARGVDSSAARRAAEAAVARAVDTQAVVTAFDAAFGVVAASFIVAAPALIVIRRLLKRPTGGL